LNSDGDSKAKELFVSHDQQEYKQVAVSVGLNLSVHKILNIYSIRNWKWGIFKSLYLLIHLKLQ
jgi:hypothetical protein